MRKGNPMLRSLSLLLVLALLPLYGCAGREKTYTETSFAWFDTVTTLTGYEEDEERFQEVWKTVCEELEQYHRLYDIYHAYEGISNLYTVNERIDGVHREVKVDEKIMDLLLFGKEIYAQTDGRVNIAMGSVLSLWHTYRQAGREEPHSATLPPTGELEAAAKHTDLHAMILDEERGTVLLSDPQMSLDAGAIAKGYVAEMVAKKLEAEGVSGYLLNLGGNVRALGSRPDGIPFSVGVENPNGEEGKPYAARIGLADASLVTSGSYQRYYTVEGKNYHHIIDPDTGMPATGYLSVSVRCPSSAHADALSTALFLLSVEEGKRLLADFPDTEVMWILEDGRILTTDGWKAAEIDT